MRIISGRLKSRRLCSFSTDLIRPMTDRVKTSVFNTLSSHIDWGSQYVLDLFAGTGNLAFESLSRGVLEASLVDSHKKSIQIIRNNQRLLNIQWGCHVYQKDVFHFISTYKGKPFSLIFADPPFAKNYSQQIIDKLENSQAVKKGSFLVLEMSCHENIPVTKLCQLFTQKEFSDKRVLFYTF